MAKTIVLSEAVTEIESLQRKIEELEDKLAEANLRINKMRYCKIFEMLTRQGLELEWEKIKQAFPSYAIVYFDCDRLKELNRKYSIAGVNQRIQKAMRCIRAGDRVACTKWEMGRVQFGDEVAAILYKEDAQGFHDRIVASFKAQGIGLTTAIGQCISEDLDANLAPLIAQVEAAKAKKKAERFIDRSGEMIGVCIE